MTKRVLGYYPATGRIKPFDPFFDTAFDLSLEPDKIADVDCVLFWGGSDIGSFMYGATPHPKNQNRSGMPTNRDKMEKAAMDYAIDHEIPMIGVCRGAQLLCIGAGGSLYQHVDGHEGSDHTIICNDGDAFQTNTCHHQSMRPLSRWGEDPLGTFLAVCGEGPRSLEINSPTQKTQQVVAEAIWFDNISGLAIQWHPEWMESSCQATQKIYQWIEEYIIPAFPNRAPKRIFNQRQPA